MYLILTCLLALNVSKEVLQGFVTINESIETTNQNFTGNTKAIMAAIEEAIGQGRNEYVPYYAKAKEVNRMTQRVYDYVDSMKKEVIKYTEDKKGADTLKLNQVESLDNYDKPTFFVLGSDETKPSTGKYSASDLRKNIKALTDSLNAMLDFMKDKRGLKLPEKDYLVLKDKIKIFTPNDNYKDDEGKPLSWEVKNFYHLPLAAVVTNLSKIQGDLRNIEGEMVNVFASAPGKLAVPFDTFEARVVPATGYVSAGQPYTADVFLSATSSHFKKDNMEFILGEVDTATGTLAKDAIVLPFENGNGKIAIPTSAAGNRKISGWIKFRDPNGNFKYFRYEDDYVVANSAVSVSAEKMNVFYAGVENPVSVSAAGVAPHELVVNITGCNGTLENKGNGKFVAKVSGTGNSTVTVFKKTEQGLERQGVPQVFRVKRIPDPVLKVGNRLVPNNIDISVEDARNIFYVNADNSNFQFETQFKVVSFLLTVPRPRGSGYEEIVVAGNQMPTAARAILGSIKKGSKIYIEDVVVQGPDGTRKLPMVKLTVR